MSQVTLDAPAFTSPKRSVCAKSIRRWSMIRDATAATLSAVAFAGLTWVLIAGMALLS